MTPWESIGAVVAGAGGIGTIVGYITKFVLDKRRLDEKAELQAEITRLKDAADRDARDKQFQLSVINLIREVANGKQDKIVEGLVEIRENTRATVVAVTKMSDDLLQRPCILHSHGQPMLPGLVQSTDA